MNHQYLCMNFDTQSEKRNIIVNRIHGLMKFIYLMSSPPPTGRPGRAKHEIKLDREKKKRLRGTVRHKKSRPSKPHNSLILFISLPIAITRREREKRREHTFIDEKIT